MAVMTRKTLVLRDMTVVRDVVTGLTGMGFVAKGQTPLPISSHPSQRYQTEHDLGRRLCAHWGADNAGTRAGRPERRVGVPSRSPASFAGRAIRLGWALASGEPAPKAVWRLQPCRAKRDTARGKALGASTRGSDS
jgi:hypothetical protein